MSDSEPEETILFHGRHRGVAGTSKQQHSVSTEAGKKSTQARENEIPATSRFRPAYSKRQNKNEELWRQHEKPETRLFITKSDYQQFGQKDMSTIISRVKEHSEAFIHQSNTDYGVTLSIYGDPGVAHQAAKMIRGLLPSVTTAAGAPASAVDTVNTARAFDKLRAFNEKEWRETELTLRAEQRKLQYLRAPDEDCEYHSAIVHWSDELRERDISIQMAMGTNLEALDPIRTHNEVYVSLTHADGQMAFLVQALEPENVHAAEAHLKSLMKTCEYRCYEAETFLFCIDQWKGGKTVLFHDLKSANFPSVAGIAALPVMDLPSTRREAATDLTALNRMFDSTEFSKLQHNLLLSLESIRYRRSFFDFSIRYGRFCLTRNEVFREGEVPTNTFLDMINSGSTAMRVQSSVTKWIGDRIIEGELLQKLKSASRFLRPAVFTGAPLADVQPVYRGSFIFDDPTKKKRSLMLQIEFEADYEDVMMKKAPRWFRLPKEKLGFEENIDVNLLELADGRGWKFCLESAESLLKRTVPPNLTDFAERVKIKENIARDPTSLQFFIVPPTKTGFKFKQERIWTFGIHGTDYHLVCTQTMYLGMRPFWGLSVKHVDWAQNLLPLEKLAPGDSADWPDPIRTFFPDDGMVVPKQEQAQSPGVLDLLALDDDELPAAGPGLRLLVTKLVAISELLTGR